MCLLKVVRGTPSFVDSFRVSLDCGLPVLGLSFTHPVWKSLRSHLKSVCFDGGSFLNGCWKSFPSVSLTFLCEDVYGS